MFKNQSRDFLQPIRVIYFSVVLLAWLQWLTWYKNVRLPSNSDSAETDQLKLSKGRNIIWWSQLGKRRSMCLWNIINYRLINWSGKRCKDSFLFQSFSGLLRNLLRFSSKTLVKSGNSWPWEYWATARYR